MKRNAVRKLALCFALIVTCLVVVPVGATTISDLQKEQKELQEKQKEVKKQQEEEQKKLNNIGGQISGLEGQADVLGEEMEELDENLVVILASVEMITQDIADKEEAIAETTILYEEAKATEEAQYESMKLRIKFMYEQGDVSFLQLFLNSTGFSDMLNKAEYVEKLYEYDRRMLEEYQAARAETLAIKEQLEEEKAELEAQQHELEEEKAELETLLAEKKAQFEDYEVKIAQAKQQAAVYQANIKKQNEQIRKLQKEEADKKTAEIAAVKAAEAARKAAEAAANSSSGGGQSSGGSQNSGGGSRNYASAGSFSGSTGQQIASYACQFVGNPYVPGGTSLTDGADCSGFVWRVYKDHGYNVPRTSWSCREAGTGVSYSDAQPGDIICYAGHVGIYIGNGTIVHASTQKTGIKLTAATYKEILAVRRIV